MEGGLPHETERGEEGGLTFVTCLQIFLLLNKRSIAHFSRWKGWGTGRGGSLNWSIFVAVINV